MPTVNSYLKATVMQGPFAALSFKSIVYSFTNIINSHLISLNSQRKLLTHKTLIIS